MEKSDRLTTMSAALFFGSLWGLSEATAGHLLHLLRVPGLAGFLMYPLGFFLMCHAYRRSGRAAAVLLTSWVAASVKLADLLLPGVEIMAAWNPAQAILLEGLATAGLILVLRAEPDRPGQTKLSSPFMIPALSLSSALSWRLAYLALSLLWAALFRAPNLLQAGNAHLIRFVMIEGSINGLWISGILRASLPERSTGWHPAPVRSRLHPAVSFACLAAALCLEALL